MEKVGKPAEPDSIFAGREQGKSNSVDPLDVAGKKVQNRRVKRAFYCRLLILQHIRFTSTAC
jgi:hypothetical protein